MMDNLKIYDTLNGILTTVPIRHKDSVDNTPDVLDLLLGIPSQKSRKLFTDMYNNTNIHGIVTLNLMDLSTNQRRSYYRHLSDIHKAGLIIKVKKGKLFKNVPEFTYIINPYYVVPDNFEEACYIWETLGGERPDY